MHEPFEHSVSPRSTIRIRRVPLHPRTSALPALIRARERSRALYTGRSHMSASELRHIQSTETPLRPQASTVNRPRRMASKRKTPRRSARQQSSTTQRGRARHAMLGKRKRSAKAQTGRRTLYPAIAPYRTGFLRVSDVHELYFEECGNPKGKPALFVHGGPGAGCGERARCFFDPDAYRIVLFDQRGCGRSRPHASLDNNTTWHLVSDIERLREHLGIERWHVFGGSWGSTLSLAYAQAHPERVSALILRGIFLCRESELEWFLYGIRQFFPDAWAAFSGAIPPAERDDLLSAYHRRLMDPDPRVHLPAARAWSVYEGSCSTLLPSPETVAAFGEDRMALGLARLEAHYFKNRIFLPENALLDNVGRIRGIPAAIVQGRYDCVCPPVSADALHLAWPEAAYLMVPDAGHSAMEPGTRRALIGATERFKGME